MFKGHWDIVWSRRVWFNAATLPEKPSVINTETKSLGRGKYDLIHSLKSFYKWVKGIRRQRERYLQTERSRSKKKKKKEGRGGWGRRRERGRGRCITPENMAYLRGEEGKREQAGQKGERRAFFSRQQNFLQHLVATSQALFFRFRLRKSWLVAWSTSFRCRLCPEEGAQMRSSLQITIQQSLFLIAAWRFINKTCKLRHYH